MKIPYIIVAGPQASGKTHAKKHLGETYQNVVALDETAEMLFEENRRGGEVLGGALVGAEFEKRIVELELDGMHELLKKHAANKIYVDETSLFVWAHTFIKDHQLAEKFLLNYMQVLSNFNVGIIFTYVRPEISWSRREAVYRKRYEGLRDFEERMAKSMSYISQPHPHLVELYNRLGYPKEWVEGDVPLPEFEKRMENAFESICNEINVKVERKS